MLRRAIREPLVHFLLLGGLLFCAYRAVDGSRGSAPHTILVTQGQIEALATGFARTWQRPPTESELKGLVDDHIRQEVYAREARAFGLDRDDVVINRRLRQKLEFVTDDVAGQEEPTDAQLREYFRTHADAFKTEPRITFNHVFLSREKHGETLMRDARAVQARLAHAGASADPTGYGDATLLEPRVERAPISQVVAQFGQAFAARLGELGTGEWNGPVESEYGVHLVLVREWIPGDAPAFEDVKSAVAREWTNARREQAKDAFYRELLQRYSVTIEARRQATDVPRQDVERASARTK
jgi:hypothetical protein